jgi:hypothetical protein
MYTLQEKPDQHATHIPRSVRIWSQTICISCGQRMATFRVVPTRSKQAPTPRRNLGDQKQTRLAVILGHLILPPSAQPWSRERDFGQVVTQLHCLTGPIYQHVILAHGANPLILNQYRLGLQPPKGPAQSPVIQSPHKPLVKR